MEMRRVIPHLLIIALFAAYIVMGALTFQWIDDRMALYPITEIILFCFTTLSTIGYGNITPTNTISQLFLITYALFGIPLCMITIANMGTFLTRTYWAIANRLSDTQKNEAAADQPRLPLLVIVSLFCATVPIIVILLHGQETSTNELSVDDLYFSIISFSSIGYGDKYVTASSPLQLLQTMCFLSWGIILTVIWFAKVKELLIQAHAYWMSLFCPSSPPDRRQRHFSIVG